MLLPHASMLALSAALALLAGGLLAVQRLWRWRWVLVQARIVSAHALPDCERLTLRYPLHGQHYQVDCHVPAELGLGQQLGAEVAAWVDPARPGRIAVTAAASGLTALAWGLGLLALMLLGFWALAVVTAQAA